MAEIVQVDKFVEEQTKQGGIILSKLGGKTAVVETSRFIYEIKPLPDGCFLVNTGAPSPQNEKICTGIDSHYPLLKHNINDWVGKGMRMILRYRNGVTILTQEVVAAAVEGEGFQYELWR